jgi:hypothetical protein
MKDIGSLAILLVVLCGIAVGAPNPQPQTATPPPEVSATGGVSAPLIAKDEELRFWFTIQNKTLADISQVRLRHLPEGYRIRELCFFVPQPDPTKPRERSCATNDELNQGEIALGPLVRANQSVTGLGRLTPGTAHKKETLTLVMEWTVAGKALSSSTTVNLGENQVQNNWEDWSGSWFYQSLKDLALPIVLLGIGTWLNLSAKKRDARSETLKQMLPVSHNYAAKYYLPLSRAAERAVSALYEITMQFHPVGSPLPASDIAKLDSAKRRSFFYVVLARKIMDATREEIGGLYFKDLRGERLAAMCLKKFEKLLGEDTDPLSLSLQRLTNLFKTTETLESFETRFGYGGLSSPLSAEEADKSTTWMYFEPWLEDDNNRQKAIQYLSALTIVLDFEANRPYEQWYDVMSKMEVTSLDKNEPTQGYVNVRETLQGFASESFTTRAINSYLKS